MEIIGVEGCQLTKITLLEAEENHLGFLRKIVT